MKKPNYIDWTEEQKKKLANGLAGEMASRIFTPSCMVFSEAWVNYKVGFTDGFLKALNLVEASTHADR